MLSPLTFSTPNLIPTKLARDRIKKRNSCHLHLHDLGSKSISKEMKAKNIFGSHEYGIHDGIFSAPDLLLRNEKGDMMDDDKRIKSS